MCILLKLDYAKFGVSNLLFGKVIEEKPSEVGSTPPPLRKGRVDLHNIVLMTSHEIDQHVNRTTSNFNRSCLGTA